MSRLSRCIPSQNPGAGISVANVCRKDVLDSAVLGIVQLLQNDDEEASYAADICRVNNGLSASTDRRPRNSGQYRPRKLEGASCNKRISGDGSKNLFGGL